MYPKYLQLVHPSATGARVPRYLSERIRSLSATQNDFAQKIRFLKEKESREPQSSFLRLMFYIRIHPILGSAWNSHAK